ncbi:MAG TPA: hypothetical protein VK812_11430 [Candidatus Binatus sp.]|nr:hypothetical protein [Candidatus Binatus sp.]
MAAAISLGLAQQPGKPAGGSVPAKSDPPRVTTPASQQKPNASSAGSPMASGPVPGNPGAGSSAGAAAPPGGLRTNLTDSDLVIRLTRFTEALALVAALQLLTLIWQGFALRKILRGNASHAHEMEHQSSVMDEQLKIMAAQLSALKDTASAASASATAARENVDLIVKKERARLRIELAPFYLNFGAPSPANYAVQHEGSTDAFVLSSHAAVYVSDSREPDPSLGTGKPMPIPSAITAQNPVVTAQDVLHPFTEEEIDSIRQLKSFVHFTGFVRYKDVFDAEHETRFNRVWSIAQMNNLGQAPFTYWEHCGGADENRET